MCLKSGYPSLVLFYGFHTITEWSQPAKLVLYELGGSNPPPDACIRREINGIDLFVGRALSDILRNKVIGLLETWIKWWADPDSNWGPSPCQGDVIAGLDHRPIIFQYSCFHKPVKIFKLT